MLNLTIDIGNTCTKTIIFDDTVPILRESSIRVTAGDIRKLGRYFQIDSCMISSVVKPEKALLNQLKKLTHFEQLTASTKIPLKNLYSTPKTLGSDRLSNAIAGSFLFPKSNVLIVDSGTCIKYDFVNAKRQYVGGSISPGLEMRFKALHQFTGRLPLIKEMKAEKLTGNSTVSAIRSGVINGMVEEMNGIVRQYQKKYRSLKVIFTGGDSKFFAGQLNLSIFAAADMVNIGLNEIIRYNQPGS